MSWLYAVYVLLNNILLFFDRLEARGNAPTETDQELTGVATSVAVRDGGKGNPFWPARHAALAVLNHFKPYIPLSNESTFGLKLGILLLT